MNKLITCYNKAFSCTDKAAHLPSMLARIIIGWIFIEAGWGKLHHLDHVVEFFTSLGIPFPQLQAPFVATVELVGGIFILIGLFTRLSSLVLIPVMGVAILTANRADIEDVSSLFSMSEFLFIILLIGLVVHGAGCFSADRKLNIK